MKFISNDKDKVYHDVIYVALDMFLKNGFAPVKMDDVAAKLSISKRTLYELFPSKENLILECAKECQKMMERKMESEFSKDNNVISIMLRHYSLVLKVIKDVNASIFFEGMVKYPSVREFLKTMIEPSKDRRKYLLKLGVEQGLIRENMNMDLLLEMVFELSKSLAKSKFVKQFSIEELFNSVILVIVKGFATDKGIKEIDRIIEKEIFTTNDDEKMFWER